MPDKTIAFRIWVTVPCKSVVAFFRVANYSHLTVVPTPSTIGDTTEYADFNYHSPFLKRSGIKERLKTLTITWPHPKRSV